MTISRISALRSSFAEYRIDRALVTSAEDVRYLSGFTGSSAWLAIGPEDQVLLTDFRYKDQASKQAPGWTVYLAKAGLPAAVRELAAGWGAARVGYEPAFLTVRDFRFLVAQASDGEPPIQVSWVETERLVGSLAVVKDAEERETIARAARITDAVFHEVLSLLTPGMSERELAAEMECIARKRGADGMAFPPIVASGPNAALPHAQPTDREISVGDMVIFDLGANVRGYASDMTRTVAVGSVSPRLREIYGIVAGAQEAALEAVRPGITGVELDAVARSLIAAKGYGEAFGHALGHGLGLRIHDAPSISWRSQDTLEEGMVLTIEPGIYLTGWGGVRIEDLVVVTANGCEILSRAPKELVALKNP